MSSLADLKNISEKDRQMIREAEVMLGPEPSEMGIIKNLFWGRFREDLLFPYPESSAEEKAKCERLLAELNEYLENEHPSVLIDREEMIPDWALDRLFKMGVMGMTVPVEYGGLGLGVTSYNRVLAAIGSRCAGTSVVVSAHQSIGCKALMLFGNEKQKAEYLPKVANEYLSAFCLSEPNVGCDAAGQETWCTLSPDGRNYILNGEKKWITSGALAGLFTVMARNMVSEEGTSELVQKGINALIVDPDTEGIEIFEKNRSKAGIRGTWQARIRFTDVKVPVENLLHKEGRGLQVALTCLNYGRCTLSAGTYGASVRAMNQGIKWARTRYQFQRPLGEFELVQKRIANMAALTYAMDAMLYLVTGMLDRGDDDVMVETAASKVFCSEMAWRVVNDAMQIMGGEGYMTENELERIFRDSRIYLIVEGANEVMQSFIFAYGGKKLAEQMLYVKDRLYWETSESVGSNLGRILPNLIRPKLIVRAIRLGAELCLGTKRRRQKIQNVHASLRPYANRLSDLSREQSYMFKVASMEHREDIVTHQATQARLADAGIWLFALAVSLSKRDMQVRKPETVTDANLEAESFAHLFDLGELEIRNALRDLSKNADVTMRSAAQAAMAYNDTLPNSRFIVPERSPVAAGTGRTPAREGIPLFPGDTVSEPAELVG